MSDFWSNCDWGYKNHCGKPAGPTRVKKLRIPAGDSSWQLEQSGIDASTCLGCLDHCCYSPYDI